MYTIIDVQDESRKARLAELCDHQPFIARAPWVLVFCADYRKWYDTFVVSGAAPRAPGVGDLILAVSDACIAAENAVVAAESYGIGSCYIGDVMENCEEMRDFLDLPPYVFPAAMLVFGYPTEEQKARKKPERCRLSDIVCVDRYHRKTGEELRKTFRKECAVKTFEEWAQAFCKRKYNSDFAREMTRSVAVYLQDYLPHKD